MSALDNLGGGSFIKWGTPGRKVTGTITAMTERQATKFKTSDPDTWPDGNPKMQLLFTLDTAERDADDANDDGERRFDVNKWGDQVKALRAGVDAFKVQHGRAPDVGDSITVTHVAGAGGAEDPRKFTYLFAAGASVLDAVSATPAAAVAQPPLTPENPIQDVTPPPAAPAAPVAGPPSTSALQDAKDLLAGGLDEATVAASTGLAANIVAALANVVRQQQAAA